MRVALLITIKDLRQRARDRSAFVMALVLPLALAFIFSQILGGTSGTVTLNFAVADLDGGQVSRGLVEDVLRPIEESGQIELTEVATADEARVLVEEGEVGAAIIVPEGFTNAVSTNEPATILVLTYAGAQISPVVATSITQAFAGRITAVQTTIGTLAAAGALEGRDIADLTQRAAEMADPVTVNDVSAESRELDPNTFYAAGMAVFFLFFTVQFGIAGILDERRDGTLSRILAAPVHRWEVLVGKLASSLLLGVVSMVVLAIATSLLFGAEWGDPLGVMILIIAGVIAATSVGALVVTFVNTPDQASSAQSIIAMVLGMLGGSFFPVALAGGLIQTLSLATPHAWFLRGLGELQGGGGLADIVVPTLAILAFSLVVGGTAVLRQQRLVRL